MRVRPPRTDTTISSFRWVAPGDATQEKDRPSWLTCHAEVGDDRMALREEDVLGLDVPVQDAHAVRGGTAPRQETR